MYSNRCVCNLYYVVIDVYTADYCKCNVIQIWKNKLLNHRVKEKQYVDYYKETNCRMMVIR